MFMMAMDEMRQAPGLKMWKHHTSTPRHPVRPRDGSMPSIRCPQTPGDPSTACMPVTDQQGGRWRYCAVLKYPSGQNRQKRNTQTKKYGCEDPGIKSPSQRWACIFKLGAWTGVGFGFFRSGRGRYGHGAGITALPHGARSSTSKGSFSECDSPSSGCRYLRYLPSSDQDRTAPGLTHPP